VGEICELCFGGLFSGLPLTKKYTVSKVWMKVNGKFGRAWREFFAANLKVISGLYDLF
jgi:hypothetical protein